MNPVLFGFLLGVSASLVLGAVVGIILPSYRHHQRESRKWTSHLNELWDATALDTTGLRRRI